MKILTIFTQPIENNTSSMIRCRNVLNGIASLGNDIIVYSPYPNVNSMYYGKEYKIDTRIVVRRYGKESNNSTHGNNAEIGVKGTLRKIYRKFDLFGSSIIYVKYTNEIIKQTDNEKIDMVLSLSSPIATHIISNKLIKRKKGLRYIQQWGDPLVADITRKSLTPKWVQHIIESCLICKADKIFYVSPITLQGQRKMFPKYKDKMEFVPTPAEERIYEIPSNNKLKIGYFGSYQTSARNIMPLYETAKMNKEVELLVVGDSDIELAETENIKRIVRTTPEIVDEMMKQMDVIICLMNSSGGQIPGKIYNYACTNKEILMITDGEQGDAIREFFDSYDRFTFVENNGDAIGKQLKKYIEGGVPIRQSVKEFTPEVVAKKVVQV